VGYSDSFFAVHGWSLEEAVAALDLRAGEEVGDFWKKRLAVAELPDGWLVFGSRDYARAFQPPFVALSRRGTAVACAFEDHVAQRYEARGYKNGVESWRVLHDREKTDEPTYHLEVSGDPPASLEAIRAARFQEQEAEGGDEAGADYVCETALDLAKAVCGFHPEECETLRFRELLPRRSVFQRLFGRPG
jgi:hypothetical protein